MIARSLAPTWCSCHVGNPAPFGLPVRAKFAQYDDIWSATLRSGADAADERRLARVREQRRLAEVVERIRNLGRVRRRERRLPRGRRRVLREIEEPRLPALLLLIVGEQPHVPERAVVGAIGLRLARFLVGRMRIEAQELVRKGAPARTRALLELRGRRVLRGERQVVSIGADEHVDGILPAGREHGGRILGDDPAVDDHARAAAQLRRDIGRRHRAQLLGRRDAGRVGEALAGLLRTRARGALRPTGRAPSTSRSGRSHDEIGLSFPAT